MSHKVVWFLPVFFLGFFIGGGEGLGEGFLSSIFGGNVPPPNPSNPQISTLRAIFGFKAKRNLKNTAVDTILVQIIRVLAGWNFVVWLSAHKTNYMIQ